jgi:cobalt/nickel transport system permease protein
MHMADALLSPSVGGVLWLASSAALVVSSRRVRTDPREHLVPLMGVLGAFVFAAMMVNFSIPGTGSSGHLGGGLLLSILLGPHAAFVVMASVLTVQALFFADGGLLALGANIFNLGVFPCFIGFPLIYRSLVHRAGPHASRKKLGAITVFAAVIGLQLGALGVVTETCLSGISSLPLGSFLLLMQPMHLAIGLIEGLATAVLIGFVRVARPDLFDPARLPSVSNAAASRSAFPSRVIAGWALVALLTASVISGFASTQPDGLEWSIARITGSAEMAKGRSALHARLSELQKKTGLFADYTFPLEAVGLSVNADTAPGSASSAEETWPAVQASTSLAGVVGGLATLVLVSLVGLLLRRPKKRG